MWEGVGMVSVVMLLFSVVALREEKFQKKKETIA